MVGKTKEQVTGSHQNRDPPLRATHLDRSWSNAFTFWPSPYNTASLKSSSPKGGKIKERSRGMDGWSKILK